MCFVTNIILEYHRIWSLQQNIIHSTARRVKILYHRKTSQNDEYLFPPPEDCSSAAHVFLNTLRPRQNGRHLADDIFKQIFLNENVWILIKISLKFIPNCPINNIPTLVQIMAWGQPGNKPLSEPMRVSLLTHIWVTQPQWVNCHWSAR